MGRLLAAALLTLTVQAQHREEITVELVEVPVYVHDATGPVEGLTRDRFQLFVNGVPREIESFDVVEAGQKAPAPSVAPDGEPPPDVRRRRLFLLVFDLVFSRAAALERARLAAARVVAEAPPTDAFAVATHTAAKGLQFLVPFTTDRAVVENAIVKLRATTADDPLRLRISDSEREAIVAWMPWSGSADTSNRSGRGDPGAGILENPFTGGGEAMEDNRKQPVRRLIENQVQDLGDLSTRLAQLDGQKHVVFFSEGFNPYAVHDVTPKRTATAPQTNSALMSRIHEMYRRLQSADTFVHAVDIAGLRHGFDPLVNDALHLVSSGTGGTFIRNANDLAGALQSLEQSHRASYILGFRPRGAKSGSNRIEVKVRDLPRGTVVSYRRGFSGRVPETTTIDGLRLADILTNDLPQHGIAIVLERSADGVVLTVPVSAWAGLPDGERPEALLYVFDAAGVAVESRRILLSPGAERFAIPVSVQPGSIVKVLVRAREALGFARLRY